MKEKDKIVFVINPVSGKKRPEKTLEVIEKRLDHTRFTPEYILTKQAGDATQIAKDSLNRGILYIVAVGGDGTINETARALINSKAYLGIIPSGSGNGFARHLGIPSNKERAVDIINLSHTQTVDYGLVNGLPFFCTFGVGFDAHVGHMFAMNPKRGFNTYIKTTLQEFMQYRPEHYKIKIGDKKLKGRAFLITAANASQYGNNAYIAPHADISDGLLDVSIVKPFPLHRAINFGLSLFNKQITKEPYVDTYRTNKLTIKRKSDAGSVHIDGEPIVLGKKIKIKIIPKGLQVIVPATRKNVNQTKHTTSQNQTFQAIPF